MRGHPDGQAELWYDGTLIVASGGQYIGVPIPGAAPAGYRKPPAFAKPATPTPSPSTTTSPASPWPASTA